MGEAKCGESGLDVAAKKRGSVDVQHASVGGLGAGALLLGADLRKREFELERGCVEVLLLEAVGFEGLRIW